MGYDTEITLGNRKRSTACTVIICKVNVGGSTTAKCILFLGASAKHDQATNTFSCTCNHRSMDTSKLITWYWKPCCALSCISSASRITSLDLCNRESCGEAQSHFCCSLTVEWNKIVLDLAIGTWKNLNSRQDGMRQSQHCLKASLLTQSQHDMHTSPKCLCLSFGVGGWQCVPPGAIVSRGGGHRSCTQKQWLVAVLFITTKIWLGLRAQGMHVYCKAKRLYSTLCLGAESYCSPCFTDVVFLCKISQHSTPLALSCCEDAYLHLARLLHFWQHDNAMVVSELAHWCRLCLRYGLEIKAMATCLSHASDQDESEYI